MKYFFPGLKETKKDYPLLFSQIKNLKLKDDYLDEAFLNTPKVGADDILIGFSIGALTAYLAVVHSQKCQHLILCSPTPAIRQAKKPHAKKISILVGEKEHPIMKNNAKWLGKKWGAKVYHIKSGHKINKVYVEVIKGLL